MEISDGGAAAVEFASEDSDDESFRHQPDSSNEMELGKLPDESDEESQVVEPPAEEDGVRPAKVAKTAKQDSKAKRQSVEARLDMLSSTLLVVKELLTKSGITGEGITDDRNKKEAIFGFMQSCCSCLSCQISCSTACGITCMSSAHCLHVICTLSAHHLHVIRTSSACHLHMHVCCLHQDTSSAHCLQAICTTPHGHRGPELSFTVTRICY